MSSLRTTTERKRSRSRRPGLGFRVRGSYQRQETVRYDPETWVTQRSRDMGNTFTLVGSLEEELCHG